MSPVEAAGLVQELARLGRLAGAAILAWYGRTDVREQTKADNSPVTAADLAAHAILADGLVDLLSGVPVVSEEGGPVDELLARVRAARRFWLVDPLDGTRDFLAHSGEFAVSVALVEDGRPSVGLVHAPASGDSFVAVLGHGAYRLDEMGVVTQVHSRRLAAAAWLCLVSRQHQAGEADRVRRTWPLCAIQPLGSALKYARIAEGAADLTLRFTPTSLWDTAAADCLLTEAGGILAGFDGAPLSYAGESLTNPPFFAAGDKSVDWPGRIAALLATTRD